MKPCDVPPRYLVRLPEGEREFDAPEILKLFMEFKIDTVTPVRPTGGGEWRELRQVPEFSFELYRRYRRLRDRMRTPVWSHWLYIGLLAFFPLFSFLMSSADKMFANWQMFFAQPAVLMVVILIPLIASPSLPPSSSYNFWKKWFLLFIPVLNYISGFLLIREFTARLAPEQRRIPRLVNGPLWVTAVLLYASIWIFPGTVGGGICFYSLYVLFLVLYAFLAIPISVKAKQDLEHWLARNPAPAKPTGKTHPRICKAPFWRPLFAMAGLFAIVILLLLAAIRLPQTVVATLQLRSAEAEFSRAGLAADFKLQPEEPAGDSAPFWRLMNLSIPRFPDSRDPRHLRDALQILKPKLDRFREALQSLDQSKVTHLSVPNPLEDRFADRLENYLDWRIAEWNENPRPAGAAKLLREFSQCCEYAVANSARPGLFTEMSYLTKRSAFLSGCLQTLPPDALQTEKTWWEHQPAVINRLVKRDIFGKLRLSLLVIQSREIPGFLQDTLHADALNLASEQWELLQQDFFENHAAYARLDEKIAWSNVFLRIGFQEQSGQFNRLKSRTVAQCRLTFAGIEFETFRREHGRWPEHPELPRDPFSGKPLRYLPGRLLYSAGPEGRGEDSGLVFRLEQRP